MNREIHNIAHYMMDTKDLHRDLPIYTAYFDLSLKSLIGKKCLDIGAGAASFAKEAKKFGINIIPLDLIYATTRGRGKQFLEQNKKNSIFLRFLRKKLGKAETPPPLAVAGLGESLPFQNKTFDCIFSSFSNFFYNPNPKSILENLNETMRVLKKNGSFYLFPLKIQQIVQQKENNLLQTEGIFKVRNNKQLILKNDNDVIEKENSCTFMKYIQEKQKNNQISLEIIAPTYLKDLRCGYEDSLTVSCFYRSLVIKKLS